MVKHASHAVVITAHHYVAHHFGLPSASEVEHVVEVAGFYVRRLLVIALTFVVL